MSSDVGGLALAVVLVVTCMSSPASALSADLTLNDTVDDVSTDSGEATDAVDNAVEETSDATDSATDAVDSTSGTVDSTTDTVNATTDAVGETVDATTSDGDTSAEPPGSAGNVTVSANASTDGVDATVRTNASFDGTDSSASGTVGLSANESTLRTTGNATAATDDASLETSVSTVLNGSANATVEALLAPVVGEPADDGSADAARTDVAPTDSGPSPGSASDATESGPGRAATDSAPSSGDGGPAVPGGAPAAVGVAVVGGALAVRSGLAAAGVTPPPLGLRPTVGAAVEAIRARLPLFIPFGYSRHEDSDPLEHDVRAELYATIERTPGRNLSALDEQVSVSLSSVRHHLRILEDEALVESALINGKRRYFPLGTDDAALVAALDDAAKAAVLHALVDCEPASVSELAEVLDRDPSTVSHHLSQLAAADLVERERAGQAVETTLASDVRPVLDPDEGNTAGATGD